VASESHSSGAGAGAYAVAPEVEPSTGREGGGSRKRKMAWKLAAEEAAEQGEEGGGGAAPDGPRASRSSSGTDGGAHSRKEALGRKRKADLLPDLPRAFFTLEEGLEALRTGKLHPDAIMDEGADKSDSGFSGMTLLMLLADSSHEETAEGLALEVLAAGADVNAANFDDGQRALHYAAYRGRTGMVRFLLGNVAKKIVNGEGRVVSAAASVHARDRDGWTPLHSLTHQVEGERKAGDAALAEIAGYLIKAGADVAAFTTAPRKLQVLHLAAEGGLHRLVRVLLDSGADVNGQDEEGSAPVMYAAFRGCTRTLEMLLAAGANAHAVAGNGWSALHNAASADAADAVNILLSHGVAVNGRDGDGCTPLHIACSNKGALAAKALLAGGADVDVLDSAGSAPIHDLCQAECKSKQESEYVSGLAEAFVRAECDLNRKLPDGRTPLHLACTGGLVDVVKVITSRTGARVSLLGYGTPSSASADPNETDSRGWTPLHSAAHAGRLDVVKLLILRYAGTGLRSKNGKTPRDLAMEAGHKAVAKLLKV